MEKIRTSNFVVENINLNVNASTNNFPPYYKLLEDWGQVLQEYFEKEQLDMTKIEFVFNWLLNLSP